AAPEAHPEGDPVPEADVAVGRAIREAPDLRGGGHGGQQAGERQGGGAHQAGSRRSRPVISGGGSRPIIRRRVGPTSQRAPPSRSGAAPGPATTSGTGFVVWAV